VDELAEEYLAHCRRERTPENTVRRRQSVLRAVGTPGLATREEIEAWWVGMAHLSPSTRSNALACLRSFYRWAQRWGKRADDPTARLDAPKAPAGLPRPIGRQELAHLLDTLPDDLRRAVALGAYAGLRVSEAAALSWEDLDLEARRARVVGKGGRRRLVAISPVLIDHLRPETGGNVVAAGGEALGGERLRVRVNRAMRAAGVDATFHQLRHRYGTLAYQATGDLIAVGRQMGHSSPVTTAIYSAASDEVADVIAEAVAR
jgi:integrase